MNYSEDHIALAAEYALGTLDADERALVETMMIVDHGFMEVVDAWDRKLSPLHQMVAPVEPPPHVWDYIKVLAGLTGQPPAAAVHAEETAPVEVRQPDEPDQFPALPVFPEHASADKPVETLAEAVAAVPGASVVAAGDVGADGKSSEDKTSEDKAAEGMTVAKDQAIATTAEVEKTAPDVVVEPVAAQPSNIVQLKDRKRGGAGFGAFMTAVAASLAGIIALQVYKPDLLPEQLRVKPTVKIVEVAAPASPPPAQFVAVLQQTAALPAFILTVDTTTKSFTVRKVGATPEPGKSFELWLVSDKLQRPRSLGVIGGSDFTIRPALAAYDADTINKATYAVTIEPEGGSPTGVATGPIVYTGKLIESVPELPAR
ncbi:MAG: anti-sigma factor [Pseudomonadota bacterium]